MSQYINPRANVLLILYDSLLRTPSDPYVSKKKLVSQTIHRHWDIDRIVKELVGDGLVKKGEHFSGYKCRLTDLGKAHGKTINEFIRTMKNKFRK